MKIKIEEGDYLKAVKDVENTYLDRLLFSIESKYEIISVDKHSVTVRSDTKQLHSMGVDFLIDHFDIEFSDRNKCEFEEGEMIAVRMNDFDFWYIREFVKYENKMYRCKYKLNKQPKDWKQDWEQAKKLTDFNK